MLQHPDEELDRILRKLYVLEPTVVGLLKSSKPSDLSKEKLQQLEEIVFSIPSDYLELLDVWRYKLANWWIHFDVASGVNNQDLKRDVSNPDTDYCDSLKTQLSNDSGFSFHLNYFCRQQQRPQSARRLIIHAQKCEIVQEQAQVQHTQQHMNQKSLSSTEVSPEGSSDTSKSISICSIPVSRNDNDNYFKTDSSSTQQFQEMPCLTQKHLQEYEYDENDIFKSEDAKCSAPPLFDEDRVSRKIIPVFECSKNIIEEETIETEVEPVEVPPEKVDKFSIRIYSSIAFCSEYGIPQYPPTPRIRQRAEHADEVYTFDEWKRRVRSDLNAIFSNVASVESSSDVVAIDELATTSAKAKIMIDSHRYGHQLLTEALELALVKLPKAMRTDFEQYCCHNRPNFVLLNIFLSKEISQYHALEKARAKTRYWRNKTSGGNFEDKPAVDDEANDEETFGHVSMNFWCVYCYRHGHDISQCKKVEGLTCYNCSKKGHTAKRCPLKMSTYKSIVPASYHQLINFD